MADSTTLINYNDPDALRRAWREMKTSMVNSGKASDAKSIENYQTKTVPMTILGRTVNNSGSVSVVAILGPFKCFPNIDIASEMSDGHEIIEVVEDSRAKEIRAKDKDTKRDTSKDRIFDSDEVDGTLDPQGDIRFVRKRFVEGEPIRLLDETGGNQAVPGAVCACSVHSMIWHKASNKQLSVVFKIKHIHESIKMPIDSFIDWIIRDDLTTRHFRTKLVEFAKFMSENPLASKSEMDAVAFDTPQVTFVTGLPDDYTHPRFMKPDTSILFPEIDTTDTKTFVNEDKNKNEHTMLALAFKGVQWKGARKTHVYGDSDTFFGVYASIYEEHLAPLNITCPAHWPKLMAPLCDLIRGVYVGKENAKKSADAEYNVNRLATLGTTDWDAKDRLMNSPVEDKKLSFGLHLTPSAFVMDPIDFYKKHCPPVSGEKIIECWGGKPRPPTIQKFSHRSFDSSAMLVCLNELDPNKDVSILNDPRYEFRLLSSAVPLKTANKREIYAKLSKLSVEKGDEFVDYLTRSVHTGSDEFLSLTKEEGGISDDHFVHEMAYQFRDTANLLYFFAINNEEWEREREEGLAKMKDAGLMGRIENKRPAEEPAIEDAQPAKRQRTLHDEIPLSQDDDDNNENEDEDGADLF